MSKARVFHVITSLDPGGAEKQLLELIRSSEIQSAQEVIWLKGKGELSYDFSKNYIRNFSAWEICKRNKLRVVKAIKALANRDTIVHAHLPRAEILCATLALVFRFKLVVSKHNAEPMWPSGPKILSKLLARFVYSKADSVICISKAVKDFLIQENELPNDSGRIHVVHYGVDLSQLKPENPRMRQIENGDFHFKVGTLARLEPQKDLRTLILAAAIVKEKANKIYFQIHGEGRERLELQSLVNSFELNRTVNIGERIHETEDFLASCDLFVLTSRYEGFGLVVLEAARENLPLLLSDTEAAIEIVGTEDQLLFTRGNHFQLAELILNLSEDPEKLESLRKASRKVLSGFDIKRTAREIARIYEK